MHKSVPIVSARFWCETYKMNWKSTSNSSPSNKTRVLWRMRRVIRSRKTRKPVPAAKATWMPVGPQSQILHWLCGRARGQTSLLELCSSSLWETAGSEGCLISNFGQILLACLRYFLYKFKEYDVKLWLECVANFELAKNRWVARTTQKVMAPKNAEVITEVAEVLDWIKI